MNFLPCGGQRLPLTGTNSNYHQLQMALSNVKRVEMNVFQHPVSSKHWDAAIKALREEKDQINGHYQDLKRILARLHDSEQEKLKVICHFQISHVRKV